MRTESHKNVTSKSKIENLSCFLACVFKKRFRAVFLFVLVKKKRI